MGFPPNHRVLMGFPLFSPSILGYPYFWFNTHIWICKHIFAFDLFRSMTQLFSSGLRHQQLQSGGYRVSQLVVPFKTASFWDIFGEKNLQYQTQNLAESTKMTNHQRPHSFALAYWSLCFHLAWPDSRLTRIDTALFSLDGRQICKPAVLAAHLELPHQTGDS